jgi:hypothetical protein
MGSYCEIRFDNLDVCGAKSAVPDHFCALFQESDRRIQRVPDSDPEHTPYVVYETSRSVMLDRLALLGCTTAVVRECFDDWRLGQIETWSDDGEDWATRLTSTLKALTFEEWQSRVPHVLRDQFSNKEPADEIDRNMLDTGGDDGWLWFAGYGSLISIRALLDACPDVQAVSLDISDLVGGGWLEEDVALCAERRANDPLEPRPLAPTVVLAEGSSDIRVLQHSLAALFPERLDYFSFFNHVELNVDGGANYLIKFLKAFAAARAPLRLVAIFDNDVAGAQAFEQARRLNLPRNIILVRLPYIDLAGEYPTIGPQGEHVVDVNGLAGSIELYLGQSALTKDGALRPVRWTGYVASAGVYQGEIDGKGEVEAAFLALIDSYPTAHAARTAHPDLVSVWQLIFAAVETTAEVAQLELVHHLEPAE